LIGGRIGCVVISAPHVLARDVDLARQLDQNIRRGGATITTPCDYQAIDNMKGSAYAYSNPDD